LADRNIQLPKEHTAWGDYTYESGLRCARQLLTATPRPTAIFASNDEMALGVLVAAARMGINVPTQLSVVGYDDEPHASKLYPSLTTVNQDVRKLGQLAAEKVVALCGNKLQQASEVQTVVQPRLIHRESTATLAPVAGKAEVSDAI